LSETDRGDLLEDESGGVQSVETGVRLLVSLIELGPEPMLKTLAEHAGMPAAKAHRYLTSFVKTGLVSKSAAGRYQLGPLSVRMGLTALRRLELAGMVGPYLSELRDEVELSVLMAVWGIHGPTVVRSEPTNDLFVLNVRPGSVIPLIASSTGRLFGAYLSRSLTQSLISSELARGDFQPATPEALEEVFSEVRDRSMSRTVGDLNPGINALSAPVWDHEGHLAAVITVLGFSKTFDASWDGPAAKALRNSANGISKSLGHEFKT
jgi:DNA-binding IclR family transcriptional regulator